MHKFFVLAILFSNVPVSPVTSAISDREVTERIDHIQAKLDSGSHAASLWWWGWLGGYAGAAAGQMTAYAAMDNTSEDIKQLRENLLVGSVSCLFGVAGQFIDPMVPMYAADELRALPSGNAGERARKLTQAEALLRASAEREKNGRAWLQHSLALAVNLGSGIAIWQGFHQPLGNGLINLVVGTLVAEIQIYSQPTKAIDDWAEYQRQYKLSVARGRERATNNFFISLGFGSFRAGFYF